jgi:hypothetical protein
MKLQVLILAIGVAVSAGAVGAELHRAASVATVTQVTGAPITASQSALQQPLTSSSKITISGARPTIKGGSGDD